MKANQLPSNIVGWCVRVPKKSGRSYWWGVVIEQRGDFLKVKGHVKSGKDWWTHRQFVTDGRISRPEAKP